MIDTREAREALDRAERCFKKGMTTPTDERLKAWRGLSSVATLVFSEGTPDAGVWLARVMMFIAHAPSMDDEMKRNLAWLGEWLDEIDARERAIDEGDPDREAAA